MPGQQAGGLEDAVDAGGAAGDDVGIEHHERQATVALQRVAGLEIDDGLLLLGPEPVIAWDPGVVLVGLLLHQLGQDFVLAKELVLQSGDLAVLGIFGSLAASAGVGEGGSAVLEELFLPEIEEGDREVVLLADVGDRLFLQEVETKQGDFVFRGKVAAFPGE